MINNKKYFLSEGGNKFLQRNKRKKIDYKKEILTKVIENFLNKKNILNVIEVGCSDAQRLLYLKNKYNNINFLV